MPERGARPGPPGQGPDPAPARPGRPRAADPRAADAGGGYVVPRGDGRYVLGATMEERGFDTTVTAGPLFELLRDAIELVPGLAELVIDELSAGLRPGDARQRPGDRARGDWRDCTGPPATTATGSCSRRSPPRSSSAALLGERRRRAGRRVRTGAVRHVAVERER